MSRRTRLSVSDLAAIFNDRGKMPLLRIVRGPLDSTHSARSKTTLPSKIVIVTFVLAMFSGSPRSASSTMF